MVAVDKPADRGTRKRILAYADGSGPLSVKSAVEASGYETCDSVRVAYAEFEPISIGGVDYIAATFMLEIMGQGA